MQHPAVPECGFCSPVLLFPPALRVLTSVHSAVQTETWARGGEPAASCWARSRAREHSGSSLVPASSEHWQPLHRWLACWKEGWMAAHRPDTAAEIMPSVPCQMSK